MDAGEADESGNARTLRTYEGLAERYVERTSSAAGPLVELLATEVPAGAHVLEIGSGPGWDALALEQAGYRVERTDGAAAFVDRLQRLGFPARRLDVLHGDLGGPYDAVYASAVFLHFSPAELARVLDAALRATRPGGVLAATLKKGDGEEWSHRKMDAPRYFRYWQERELARLVEAAGWSVVRAQETTPERAAERWISLLARRPAA